MLNQPLTNLAWLKQTLARHDIAPAKSLGQNFLICSEVVEAALAALEGGPPQITELGAGVGTLTQALVAHNYQVRAIEKDDDFVHLLPQTIPAKNKDSLNVVHGDLRQEEWHWAGAYQLIGNIPYNLSGLIMRRLTQLEQPPTQAIVLVQKEVGQRLRAVPPDMNLLGLAVSLWGSAQKILNVPPNCFWPRPKVYSQLVLLTPTTDNPLSPAQREATLAVAKVFFQQKRKQIGGVLRKSFKLSAADQATILKKVNLESTARPQEISKENWVILTHLLK